MWLETGKPDRHNNKSATYINTDPPQTLRWLNMTGLKDQMLGAIARNSADKIFALAGEFVHAPAEEKEAIAAGIDFERWLAEVSQECLQKSPRC